MNCRKCTIADTVYEKFISPPNVFLVCGRPIHKANAVDILRFVEGGKMPIGWVHTAYDNPMTVDDLKVLAYTTGNGGR